MTDAFLVLGMHRSGTSSVAGVLALLGATPPKTLMPADAHNEQGYFESASLCRFHEKLLESANSSWCDWFAFNSSWYKAPGYEAFKLRAKELFDEEFDGAATPLLKDPRICRFFPFWREVFSEMRVRPHIVMPVRSPLEVAQSLRKRDGFPLIKGLRIWLRHALEAEFATRDLPRAIFSWNEFLSDWRKSVDKISVGTEISWAREFDRAAKDVDEFLSPDLKHHGVKDTELRQHSDAGEWAQCAYEALLTLADHPNSKSARATLDDTRNAFEISCVMFRRAMPDYDTALNELQQIVSDFRRLVWAAQ